MIQMTPEVLHQAALNLCSMRGVEPSDSPEEGAPPFWEIAKAEIIEALQVQNSVMCAAKGLDHTGKPVKPTLLNAHGGRLN